MNLQALSRLHPEQPETLFFAPLAWLKLQWFCHQGDTEVGGFGLSAEHNPLYVEDFLTVRQRVSLVSVQFDDMAVADLFGQLVDRDLPPQRFARLWVHTHPGSSPLPSGLDEETFARRFGKCDWAVMFILSRTGQTYARLAFSAGPGSQLLLPVAVHWAGWPKDLTQTGSLDARIEQWRQEYAANIQPLPPVVPAPKPGPDGRIQRDDGWWDLEPWDEEFDGVFYEPVTGGQLDEPCF
jgi:hypothetical protein